MNAAVIVRQGILGSRHKTDLARSSANSQNLVPLGAARPSVADRTNDAGLNPRTKRRTLNAGLQFGRHNLRLL